jgi:hypothetical protein
MNETVEVVALVRQLYGNRMIDPEETFSVEAGEADALEAMDAVKRKPADPKAKKYNRRDMRAEV